jgi:hypothetical protein
MPLSMCFQFSSSIQRDLYEESFRSLVESVLGGYNGKMMVDLIAWQVKSSGVRQSKIIVN